MGLRQTGPRGRSSRAVPTGGSGPGASRTATLTRCPQTEPTEQALAWPPQTPAPNSQFATLAEVGPGPHDKRPPHTHEETRTPRRQPCPDGADVLVGSIGANLGREARGRVAVS